MRRTDRSEYVAAREALRPGEPDQMSGAMNAAPMRVGLRVLLTFAWVAMAAGQVNAQADLTVSALKIAYARECNTQLHYMAYAARADREGQPVAALAFRSAAAGESVHAAQHAARLEALDVRPDWTRESVVIRSAEENLCTAIAKEMAENRFVYRQLVDQVRSECDYDGMASLNFARTAELTHAALLAEVLRDLAKPQDTPGLQLASFTAAAGSRVRFYVCTGDGSVFTHAIEHSCPNCGSGINSFRAMEVERTLTVE